MQASTDKYFEEHRADAGIGRKALRGGAAIMAARLINVVVQLGSTIVLARILGPHDFGLATMVLAITLFAPILIDLGTTDASTQRSKITHQQISTLFWLNIGIGIVLTVLLALSSGFVARMFGQPALAEITLVSSLTFAFTGLAVQHYALMRRALEFDRIALIDVGSNVLSSIIAVAMALMGFAYWALVLKPLLMLLLVAAGAWWSCRWVPGAPKFDSDVRDMLRFGLGVTGFSATDHMTRSFDRLAIGYFYGPGPLGFFQNAYLLYGNLISLLAESLHNVATASLSKLKSEPAMLKRSWATGLSMLTFFSSGIFAVLTVVGEDFVYVLLGPKWEPVGPLVCILSVRGIAHSVERTLGWLHVVAGRPDRWMRWGMVSAGCQMIALCIGLPFGVTGVAIVYTIAIYLLFLPALIYAGEPLGINAHDIIKACGPQVVAGAVAGIAGYFLEHIMFGSFSAVARVVLSSCMCMAIYLGVLVGLFRVTEPLRLLFVFVQEMALRRKVRA